jgi:hypothetical protein
MYDISTFLSSLPDWLRATLTLTGGLLLAIVIRYAAERLLTVLRFNKFCERSGVSGFLRTGEIWFTPAQLASRGLFWVVLIATALEAARVLDIGAVGEFRRRVVSALPAALTALLVLAVGLAIVAFVAGFVRTVARNAGNPYATLLSRLTRWLGVFLVLAIAVEQVEIRGTVLAGAIHITFGAIAFGAALAFGLGCKDMARTAMERLMSDIRERHRNVPQSDMEG